MCTSDHQNSQTLQKSSFSRQRRPAANPLNGALLLLLSSFLATACQPQGPVAAVDPAGCGDRGRLTADLFGAIEVALDWQGDVLECDGMPRPNGAGARLHFAGPAQAGSAKRSLAFILAMPDLRRGEVMSELPTKVTLMEEGTGRFFSTQEAENCWTDIHQHELVDDMHESEYRVTGILYCLAPLAELNGKAHVTFAELQFTGRLSWEMPK